MGAALATARGVLLALVMCTRTTRTRLAGAMLLGALVASGSVAAAEDATGGETKGARDAEPLVQIVHLRVTDTAGRKGFVSVQENGRWSRVCDLPCEVDAPRGTRLRIRIDDDHADVVADGDPSVTQEVVVKPDTQRKVGTILMVGGAAIAVGGFIGVLANFLQFERSSSDDGVLVATSAISGTGVALLITGAFVGFGRSDVQLVRPNAVPAPERRHVSELAPLLPSPSLPFAWRLAF